MEAFGDKRYTNFCDYILGVTEEIWERRRIDRLNSYYSDDIVVRSPTGVAIGNKAAIDSTRATLAEFPDRQLLGEDVIWGRMGEDSWLSSHRLLSTATHLGGGLYGPASGKSVVYRTIAECHAHACEQCGWQIDDEWLIRDQGAIIRQIGIDPKSYAADMIAREGGAEACVRPYRPGEERGSYQGKGNDSQPALRYSDLLKRLMRADMAAVSHEYDRACQLELPGGVTGHGRAAADFFWLGLRSSFPTAEFSIEHAVGIEEAAMPARAAIRWSLTGAHAGHGMFGEPSGADIYVMGASHAEYGPRRIKREFVVLDEIAVWKQILIQTG